MGVDGLALFENGDWVDEMVVTLLAYDAGTDSGATFTSPNQVTVPQQPITLITGGPFTGADPLGTFTFTRTDAPQTFQDLGGAIAGTKGDPVLVGTGLLEAGEQVTLDLSNALGDASAFLVIGLSSINLPVGAGLLVPTPDAILAPVTTAPDGSFQLATTWPGTVAPGTPFFFQYWMLDPGGFSGYAASNGVCRTSQ